MTCGAVTKTHAGRKARARKPIPEHPAHDPAWADDLLTDLLWHMGEWATVCRARRGPGARSGAREPWFPKGRCVGPHADLPSLELAEARCFVVEAARRLGFIIEGDSGAGRGYRLMSFRRRPYVRSLT